MARSDAGSRFGRSFVCAIDMGAYGGFLTRCVPIRDPKHSIMGWVGTSIDVDDEKRAAEALELSERRYRSVSEAFDFGMWSADSAGRLTFVSPRFLGFLGVTLEGMKVEQVEVHVWSAIQSPAKEIREAAIRWERCKATGEPWEWEYSLRGHDGTVRRVWTRGIPLRGPTGLVSSWAGFHLDVTEQYTAARARDQARPATGIRHKRHVGRRGPVQPADGICLGEPGLRTRDRTHARADSRPHGRGRSRSGSLRAPRASLLTRSERRSGRMRRRTGHWARVESVDPRHLYSHLGCSPPARRLGDGRERLDATARTRGRAARYE